MEAVRLIISGHEERPSSPSVMSTTGPEIELEEIPKIATLQERKERPSSPSVMSTTGPERELEEIPKIVKLQERKESLWNNKVMKQDFQRRRNTNGPKCPIAPDYSFQSSTNTYRGHMFDMASTHSITTPWEK
ncbi:uncharacterized protein LOC111347179 isoform X6 [Stylophora pistillata]|uniref:uncharacterized protein LOC111347179 isoform X6 n=1 Tax=Stylophora pistillata TaxID=50429 RepID=UPI000C0546B3|nr:uncharacterized protein LOC111347179 isoform X6 [Stylophora pistillata]XP_022810175.1 uncharacterized protein LOC111347179 isoform X7 [Stylophora pistillata]XP_022810176.1 uncharacterized protein LOC111347179 isoform X6 [Stylophora pistillata]